MLSTAPKTSAFERLVLCRHHSLPPCDWHWPGLPAMLDVSRPPQKWSLAGMQVSWLGCQCFPHRHFWAVRRHASAVPRAPALLLDQQHDHRGGWQRRGNRRSAAALAPLAPQVRLVPRAWVTCAGDLNCAAVLLGRSSTDTSAKRQSSSIDACLFVTLVSALLGLSVRD